MSGTTKSSLPQQQQKPSSTILPMHVLGSGSIGLLYASAIHDKYYTFDGAVPSSIDASSRRSHTSKRKSRSSQHPVTLLMRSHHKPRLQRWDEFNDKPRTVNTPQYCATVDVHRTLNSDGNSAIIRRSDIPVELIDDEINTTGYGARHLQKKERSPIQCILLCTKANDAISALDSVWDRLLSCSSTTSPAQVIILSNGALAIRDAIYKHFGHSDQPEKRPLDIGVQIVLGTTTHGAYQTKFTKSTNDGDNDAGCYNITHAGQGSTHCTSKDFVRMCQSIGWKSAALSDLDMNAMLWKKLAVNCVVNPLTAIHGVKNGQLIGIEHMGQDINVTVRNILEEVSLVAMNATEHNACQESVKDQLSVTNLERFVFKVMNDTKNNVSSMLQDVNAKRATEVRFLNGYVSSVGQKKYGLECPWNMEMCRLVEKLS